MARELPIFRGSDPRRDHIEEFFDRLDDFLHLENIESINKVATLRRAIKQPAKREFEAAFLPAAANRIALGLAVGDRAQEIGEENYERCRTWLTNKYFGADQQEILREALLTMQQRQNESPTQFYSRVVHEVNRAGYDAATTTSNIEQIWRRGIQADIKLHLATTARQDLAPSVSLAERYWNAYNAHDRGVFSDFYEQETYQAPRQIMQRPPRTEPPRERRPREIRAPAPAPPRAAPPPPEDPLIADLVRKYEQLSAHVMNTRQGYDRRAPLQFANRDDEREYRDARNNRRAPLPDQRDTFRRQYDRATHCYNCGEEGHFARDCRTESKRRSQPLNAARQTEDARTIAEYEDSEPDFDWNDLDGYETDGTEQAYPANLKPALKQSRSTPYPARPGRPRKAAPFATATPAQDEVMAEEPFDQVESESQKELGLLQEDQNDDEEFNLYDEIKNIRIPIPFSKLVQLSPRAKAQLVKGVTKKRQKKETTTNALTVEEDYQPTHTSAYIRGIIGGQDADIIPDTGAGCSIISKAFLDRIDWPIEKAASTTLSVANGKKTVPLGIVCNVPVTLAQGIIITVKRMVVSEGTDYDALLGNDALDGIHGIIDINAQRMRITYREKKYLLKLTTIKGRRPPFQTAEDAGDAYSSDEEGERAHVISETLCAQNTPFDTQEWFFKNYQPTESLPWITTNWQPDEWESNTDWSQIDQRRDQEPIEMGWPAIPKEDNPWGSNDDPDWESKPTPEITSVSTAPPIRQSARAERFESNLRNSRCPHGQRFYGPSAECWQCDVETFESGSHSQRSRARATER